MLIVIHCEKLSLFLHQILLHRAELLCVTSMNTALNDLLDYSKTEPA
jgi:hypothetical protein